MNVVRVLDDRLPRERRAALVWRGVPVVEIDTPSRVIAMLLPMYGSCVAYSFGATTKRWTISG